jgi:hypothetical protein
MLLTDYIRLNGFSLIESRLRSNNGRRLLKIVTSLVIKGGVMTYWFHCCGTLLLWLVLVLKERAEKSLLLFHINIKIFVVINCTGCQPATLWVRSSLRRLSTVDSFLNDSNSLMPIQEIRMRRVHITRLHASRIVQQLSEAAERKIRTRPYRLQA